MITQYLPQILGYHVKFKVRLVSKLLVCQTFENMAERFASFFEEELKVLIENKDFKNTKRTIKTSVKILNDYFREKNLEEPQDKTALANALTKFYAGARKSDGKLFENV